MITRLLWMRETVEDPNLDDITAMDVAETEFVRALTNAKATYAKELLRLKFLPLDAHQCTWPTVKKPKARRRHAKRPAKQASKKTPQQNAAMKKKKK